MGAEQPVSPNNRHRALQPPTFTVRALLMLVTACCALLALINVLPALWSAGLITLLCLAGAHIAGNSLGSRLRSIGDELSENSSGSGNRRPLEPSTDRLPQPIANSPPAAATRLRQKRQLSVVMPITTCLVALAGGIAGGTALALFNGEQGTYAGLVLGTLSCSFLGGFLGFLGSSFFEIFNDAWNQAAETAPDLRRRRRS